MTGIELKKILVISTSYPTNPKSVSGIFVKRLVDALSFEGCSLNVLTPDEPHSLNRNGLCLVRYGPKSFQTLAHAPGGVPAQLQSNRWRNLLVPFLLCSMLVAALVKSRGVGLLHANWAVSGAIGAFVKMLSKKPLVTTLRGEDVSKNLSWPSRIFLKLSVVYSDAVVVVSDDMLDLLVGLFPKYQSRFHVIYNGVGQGFLGCSIDRPAARQLNFVSTGSLIPRKNYPFILEMLAFLKASGVDFYLNVIGEGAMLVELQSQLNKTGLNECVSFVGKKSEGEIINLLQTSDIYISASLHEGRPNGVIEAMASGCCLVLSNIDGHRELVEQSGGGILFDLHSPEVCADEVIQLIGNRDSIRSHGQASRNYIIDKKISWPVCARRYQQLYSSVMGLSE